MKYSPQLELFCALLRTIREEAGLSQMALAKKLSKPQSYVCKAELGERRLDYFEIMDFCKACHVPFQTFIARFEKADNVHKRKPRSGSRPHRPVPPVD